MDSDYDGLQFHRDGPRTECTLYANENEKQHRIPRRKTLIRAAALQPEAPCNHHDRNDQHTYAHRQIAMYHFDPRLHYRHRAIGHQGFRSTYMLHRLQGVGMAVTTWPVRATEAGICQPRESTEHDYVEGQEQSYPDQLAILVRIFRRPNDHKCQQGDEQSFAGQLEQGIGINQLKKLSKV